MLKERIALVVVFLTAMSTTLVAGQVASIPVQTQPPEKAWSFIPTPYGWMSSIKGTIGAGDLSAHADIPIKEVLERKLP